MQPSDSGRAHPPAAVFAGAARISEDSVRRLLIDEIARRARISAEEVDPDRPLEEFGLASRDAVAIAGELERMLGRSLPATLVWDHPTIDRLSRALAGRAGQEPAKPPPARPASPDDPIAVVGLGCRFPGGAAGPAAYWSLLRAGGDAIGEVPDGRWEPFDDGSPEVGDLLAGTTRLGGFLADITRFDARFFGITPREAALMDPQQRLVLEVAWEAFEHAGIAPAGLRGSRTGVFIGVSAPEYAAFTASDLAALEPFTATGAALSIVANRLSYLLDLRGPSMIVDTACSSSLVSTHLAVRALRTGEADVALAGGVNILLSPTITMTFDQAGGTAADGRCKAFDASADGMVRAEGCGALVLKRLADAEQDGDRVLAVIRASGVNSDGRSNGLAAPSSDAQKSLLREVYGTAGIDPHEVDYVEAHGTGTLLGDPIEAAALGEVLGVGRPAGRPLLIGSAKSNLGHMESAAGVAGLIKTVLALHHRALPPSAHFKEPNPHIPFDDLRLRVVAEQTPWPETPGRPLRAGVSGFGFGGTNAHVVLEEAAARPHPAQGAVVRSYPLSDLAADRIRDHAAVLAEWIEHDPGAALADVANTLHRRNGRGRARAAVVARDRAGLAGGLRALAEGRPHPGVVSGGALGGSATPGRPLWVFSGYGAQRRGMARRLLEEEAAFAEAIDDLDGLFLAEAGFSPWDLIEKGLHPPPTGPRPPTRDGPRPPTRDGPRPPTRDAPRPPSGDGPHPPDRTDAARTMCLLFAIQIGLARMWRSYGVVPGAVAGHSMGEVSAAVVAGALTLEDGVKVICRRSKLMMRLVGGGAMAVLGASEDEVREMTRDLPDVHPAVYSSPRQTVVTGDADQVAEAVARAAAEGRLARTVKAEGAGHSPQVEPLLPELRAALAGVGAAAGRPLAGGIAFYTTALDDPRALRDAPPLHAGHWAANLRNPVRLAAAIEAAAQDGFRTFVEINAHPILAHAVGETLEAAGIGDALVVHTLKRAPKGEETDDTLTFHARLAELAIAGHPAAVPDGGAVIDVPGAPWRHERHWADRPPRAVAGRDEHPLLGAHVELPGEDRHAWRADIGTAAHCWRLPPGPDPDRTTWLADARPHGLTVLPAAAVAEMALAAGAVVLGHDAVRVNSLWIERPLAPAEHATVTTTYSAADQRVEIHAMTPAATWVRLASADVGEDRRAPAAPPAAPPAGPATEVVGAGRGSAHYRVHPQVLDRCLALLAAEMGPGEWLPETIGGLRAYGPTHRGGRCVVSADPAAGTGGLRLLGPDGAVLLEVTGVALRRAARSDVPVPLDGKLVEVAWERDGDRTHEDEDAGMFAAGALLAVHDDEIAELPVDWDDVGSALGGSATGFVLMPPPDLLDERLVLAVAAAARTLAASTGAAQAGAALTGGGRNDAAVPRLWIATRRAVSVRPGEHGNPHQSFVRALVRVLGFEHPALRPALVDVETAGDLRSELALDDGASEVAWRDGVRYIARLGRAALPDRRPRRIVRRGAAYIITGGYGGIGLVTAGLLAERGAGRIVLSGRSGPGPAAEKAIARLRESGMDVGIVLGDIAAPGVAERLVAAAREGGVELRGVVHGAGGIDDRLVADLGAADLHATWEPKVAGAWRLHEATEGVDLDWFAVHSSAAALLGSPGQASYAAANAALDALVAWRRARGLPGTAIGWGPWARVGGAADAQVAALDPISPEEGAEAFEALLAFDRAETGVLRFDPATAVSLFPEIRRMPYFAALVEAAGPPDADAGGPLADGLRDLDPADARRMIGDRVRARIGAVLGFAADALDPGTPLIDLGLDSLLAVRIKSAVEHDLGLTVPAALLLQGVSVSGLEDWAAEALGIGGPAPARAGGGPVPTRADDGYVMPRDAAERQAVRIFQDVLGLGRVSVTAGFFELGGHDHQADQVVAALVRELGGELTRGEVFATPTAEHVAGIIRAVDQQAARQTLRLLQPGRPDRFPFFIAHPAGGTTACYRQLAALLGPDQPVYGLERFEDAPGVEERSARYAARLLEVLPAGPFRLGGWSFGGVLAYETARLLADDGRRVDLVALFDAGLPAPVEDESDTLARRFAAFARYLNETYDLGVELSYEELAGLGEEAQVALVMERAAGLAELLPPAVLHHQLTSHQDTRSLENYRPRPYDGRVVLYRAPEETPWAVRDARYVPDDTNRFGEHCSDLEIVTVPGAHHLNLLDPPGVEVIAAHLAPRLAARDTPAPASSA